MKLIVAIIRPEKLADVKRALFEVGVTGMTLSRVSGHGGERDVVQQYRGESVVLEFHEKVRIEMACSEEFVERTIDAITGFGTKIRGSSASRIAWCAARSSAVGMRPVRILPPGPMNPSACNSITPIPIIIESAKVMMRPTRIQRGVR